MNTPSVKQSVKRQDPMQVYGDAWKPILEHHNAFQWDLDAWRSAWRSVCSPLKEGILPGQITIVQNSF